MKINYTQVCKVKKKILNYNLPKKLNNTFKTFQSNCMRIQATETSF